MIILYNRREKTKLDNEPTSYSVSKICKDLGYYTVSNLLYLLTYKDGLYLK